LALKLVSWLSRTLGTADAPAPVLKVRDRANDSRYHAVSIKPGESCCAAAKQFGRMRFLAEKAPRLPLPECDSPECACRYSHYADRRDGTDRRAVYDAEQERALKVVNRRANHGRRATDPIS
jgi:hypothetical protein